MARARKIKKHTHLGTHYIVEFFQCANLNDASHVRKALKSAAEQCGAHILHAKFHKFSPQGLTGYLLLAESHISIHTWPEYGYAAVDVFTCGKTMRPELAVSHLKKTLSAGKAVSRKITRGCL